MISKMSLILALSAVVSSKNWHDKENFDVKDKKTQSFMNIFNYDDVYTKNERYARHVKAATESVLDHLLNEIKQQYHGTKYNPNSPIHRLLHNLNKEIKRNEHNKMMKQRQKKKMNNKKNKKTGGKNISKKTTPGDDAMTTMTHYNI